MSKIKFDSDLIRLITLFESMSGAKVKDCIPNDKLIFIIEENEMGKAIGKNGANIKRLEHILKKKIKLIEFSNNVLQFVRNMVYPVEASNIEDKEGTVEIHVNDLSSKAMLIGRERKNINHLKDIVKRYFDVKELKVL